MKPQLMLLLAVLCCAATVHADWDPELERQEAAQREAERKEAARRQAEADAMRVAAMRKTLGTDANGRSDAEVRRMYAERFDPERINRDAKAQQAKAMAEVRQGLGPNAAQADAALRAMTGKSMQELQNMTDEEAEALGREMEKRYGGE
jgi:hypothetical protein